MKRRMSTSPSLCFPAIELDWVQRRPDVLLNSLDHSGALQPVARACCRSCWSRLEQHESVGGFGLAVEFLEGWRRRDHPVAPGPFGHVKRLVGSRDERSDIANPARGSK